MSSQKTNYWRRPASSEKQHNSGCLLYQTPKERQGRKLLVATRDQRRSAGEDVVIWQGKIVQAQPAVQQSMSSNDQFTRPNGVCSNSGGLLQSPAPEDMLGHRPLTAVTGSSNTSQIRMKHNDSTIGT